MKNLIQPVTIQRSFFTCGSLLILVANLSTGCAFAPAIPEGATSIEKLDRERQEQAASFKRQEQATSKDENDKGREECKARGGSDGECVGIIVFKDTKWQKVTPSIEAPDSGGMQQYYVCVSQGLISKENCAKEAGIIQLHW